jgi:hypothetical protein
MNALAIHLYLKIRYINLSFNHFGDFYRIIVYIDRIYILADLPPLVANLALMICCELKRYSTAIGKYLREKAITKDLEHSMHTDNLQHYKRR